MVHTLAYYACLQVIMYFHFACLNITKVTNYYDINKKILSFLLMVGHQNG